VLEAEELRMVDGDGNVWFWAGLRDGRRYLQMEAEDEALVLLHTLKGGGFRLVVQDPETPEPGRQSGVEIAFRDGHLDVSVGSFAEGARPGEQLRLIATPGQLVKVLSADGSSVLKLTGEDSMDRK
jgi:hypothetical protein